MLTISILVKKKLDKAKGNKMSPISVLIRVDQIVIIIINQYSSSLPMQPIKHFVYKTLLRSIPLPPFDLLQSLKSDTNGKYPIWSHRNWK